MKLLLLAFICLSLPGWCDGAATLTPSPSPSCTATPVPGVPHSLSFFFTYADPASLPLSRIPGIGLATSINVMVYNRASSWLKVECAGEGWEGGIYTEHCFLNVNALDVIDWTMEQDGAIGIKVLWWTP